MYRSAGPARGWQIPPHVAMLVPALGIAAAAALGESADLEFFASALEPARGHHAVSGIGAITYGGPVELWLGVAARHLGAFDEAVELLSDAAQLCAATGAPAYLVEAQTELVAALHSRDDPGDAAAANDLAARALASARALGMVPFVTRLAASSGRRTRTDTEPLTPRQLEVARLVAQGLTNREIAETLTLSERTAENHVQHIMLKLGLPNRSSIAVWVTQRD